MMKKVNTSMAMSKFLGVSVLALCAAAISAPAMADSAPPASGDQAGLGEIIVTARKIDEKLQDVPVAITAFSGAALKAQNATRVSDVAAFTPGLLTIQGQNNPTVLEFAIRGQAQIDDLATLEPSVGTYIDGLYVARSYGINGDLVDVSNVQVLKGPQGTLFGRNTSAGAILIQTNNPNMSAFGAEGNLTYGRYNQEAGNAVVNVPLIADTLAVRGAVQVAHRDGYITDVNTGAKYNNFDTVTGRVKALWRPAPDVSILASGEWFSYKSNGPVRVMAYGGANFAGTSPIPGYAGAVDAGYLTLAGYPAGPHDFAYYTNLAQTSPNSAASDSAPYSNTKTQTYSLTTTIDKSFGTFKLIGGYRKVSGSSNDDLDGTPYAVLNSVSLIDLHQWSIEAQLTGKALDNKLDYAVGATYFTEAGLDSAISSTLQPIVGYGYYAGDINNKSLGFYGQGTYHLTDKLAFTAGLRWSQDKKFIMTHNSAITDYTASTVRTDGCDLLDATYIAGAAPGANCSLPHADTFSAFSYAFGLDYKLSQDALLYGKVSKGYRSGGENLRADGDTATFAPFQPETNYEEEIGFKSEFFDRKVRFNVAAYYNNVMNVQRSQLLAVTSGPSAGALLTVLGNAQKERNMGIEADLAIRVTPDFTLQATGNINDSKYLQFTAPAAFGSTVLADHRSEFIPAAPKTTFTVAGNYKHDFGGVVLSGRLDYSWMASYYNSPDANGVYPLVGASGGNLPVPAAEIAASTTPAAGILGARLGVAFDHERFNVAVWGKNLTNNRDFVSSFNVSPFGLVSAIRRDPATYGVTVGAKF